MTVSNIPQCTFAMCQEPIKARGFCSHHYYKASLSGELKPKKKYKICSVEGCSNQHNSHSYCVSHYRRFQKHGTTEKVVISHPVKRMCRVQKCTAPEYGFQGICGKHYQRLKKHGTTNKIERQKKTAEQNFWSKVVKGKNNNDCWQWTAGTVKDGYGQFWAKGVSYRAHRFSFFLHNGYMPQNLVLHSCDNPPCCNPKHLREGTDQDNANDRKARGREPVGSQRSKKLTEKDILEIRRISDNCITDKSLAKQYGVSASTIYFIRKHRTWTHI